MGSNLQPDPLRILAGSGRSGTTWLLDVLCEANDLHPVFEPLHPAGWKKAGNLSRRYTNAMEPVSDKTGQVSDEMEILWNALLTGDYPSTWIDYRVRPDKLMPQWVQLRSLTLFKRYIAHWVKLWRHKSRFARTPQSNCLIKVIRANLLLPLLSRRADTEWVLTMRHPAAVVESQLRFDGDWNAQEIAACYSDDELLASRLGCDWSDWTGQMRTDAELLTLVWCLENTLPLEDIDRPQERVVFYEKLAANDLPEWGRLLDGLALQQMPDSTALRKPSQQSSEVLVNQAGPRKTSALDRLTTEDRDGIQRVLDLIGVTFYHTGSLMPEPDRLMDSKPWRSS